MANASRVTAVLGPTNTGKTHYAIDRMLGYRTGIMGFPLRLLAREVYDKIVAARGPSVVALLTGEERIVPPRAQYWICTVEAMPEGMGCDFLAIDEIQLCADPERGHVFTDRLLRARGTHETLFLGADTMRGPIQALVPGVEFVRRERMSDLVYAGSKKISRMPPRTAIVGFSVDNVYAIAELIRRQKGGAAVVMGALSPRTRNAQVALYQNGEVDYLVATDAIGMGLNLDIDHVAFASTSKFDGRRMRPLAANELAQIAGRAGRGMSHGSFGVTGDARPLDEGTAQAIMEHRFTPLKKLNWRSSALQFGTVEALIRSLEAAPQDEFLMKAREADDLGALKALSQDPDILARTTNAPSVRLLWDVCRIPDFRGISHAEHASLLRGIFNHLHGGGVVPDDWLARQIKRIDRTDGNIDALSKRLAFIRTWTYVAQRKGWLRDEIHWRNETRAVEDRLSDALHERLTEKFVDRRTSVLLRRLKQKEALLAEVNDKGEVTVEGEFVGRLEGFRFSPDKGAEGAEAKALKSASLQALAPHFHLRADRFYNAPDTEIDFTEQGGLMWGDSAIGKLVAGADPLTPGVQVFVDDAAGSEVAQKVERRLQHFISRKVQALFEPLLNLQKDEELNGLARGFAFRMVEALGLLPRHTVAQEVKDLDQDARGALRKHGVRFGQFTIFMPLLLKPAPTRLRLVLWSLANGLQDFPEAPPPGLVTVPALKDAPQGYDTMSGYREAGERMIRIDMLERLADMLRAEDSRGGFEAKPDMLSITGMTLEQFADLMQGLGYRAEKGEREKVKPADAVVAETGTPAAGQPVMDAAADAENTPAAAPAGEGAAPAADVVPEAAAIADEGVAPVAETGSDAATEEPVPEVAENETPVGEAADASVEAPEVEVFYTFTWGGRARQGGNRGQRRGQQGQDARGNAGGGKGKPRGAKGGAGGGKPGGKKGGRPQQQGGKTYSARPPKKEKKIDPDNPFAAALMGLKQGD
ncbi:helicase-related protein [Phaeobacter gallaeciensis]|uniref:helicase-related protein n=1 Tax=Phaeobacter gallaeciensis TaxID=60890 RepID=UPI00237F4DED|nr:helicase-related protein [Phaeobacter gallaeciensis]MDE4305186.1 helicase-related protein [Phaeobacter gallaeciensis]MDE4309534.1 helicase-related protein [Phaeobacter gallaeciensis]MDE4314143.1 helicase-related protein [Phaeobacter gallaeciensis]MDE4318463.1 helicase-related protein [Phaeobacter gallaeciensis]MDE4322777.1 helicase-related protein [Phaeobacter gallaeciensis]